MGDNSELTQKITQEMIENFAKVTGDTNPLHLNEDYASKTFFKHRIAHGFLYASLISRMLGTQFPGEGTLYQTQKLEFLYPVYINDILTIKVEVIEKISPKNKLKLTTKIYNQGKKLVLDGIAIVSIPV